MDNIKLSVNENSSAKYGAFSSDFYGPKVWSGYMSKFIGDINLVGTVTIDSDCSVDVSFTEENLKSLVMVILQIILTQKMLHKR